MAKRVLLLVLAAALIGVVPVWADTFQFQGQSNGTGNFTFNTSTNSLSVSNALIDTLTTLFDNSVGPCQSNCAITGGTLNMSLSGATESGGVYTFGSGGTLSVDGTVTGVSGATGALLTATFLSGATLQCANGTCDFGGTLDASSIALNSNLNIYNQDPVDGSALQTLKINIQGTNGYSGSVTEANVLVDTQQHVPEPASFALFGSGLLASAGFLRKRVRR